ncbi:hypothetical protein BH20ACT5_BH20ACT5_21950 [soil metagenome]
MAADVALSERFREQCLADESIPDDQREFACGPPASEQGFSEEFYLDSQPFQLAADLPAGAIAVAVATAAGAFVIGATAIGAEWSTRVIVTLLSWEPRRLRVLGVKTAVVALLLTVVAVVAQLAWLGMGQVLARTRGSTDVPEDFWVDFLGQGGRSVLFAVLLGLLGFGLANLIRNTGAALGIGFVYFAVLETAVRAFRPTGQPFLISDSAAALLLDGGHRIFISGPAVDTETGAFTEYSEVLLSNLRGGLTLTAYSLVLLAVGAWLFRRRDLH